jgi:glycosyltransferase involved in cell wall biosynthesis
LRIAEPGPRETAGSHAAPLSLALIGPIWPYRGGIAQYNTSLKRALGPRVARLVAISFKRQYPRWLYPGQSDVERDTDGQREPDAYYLLDPLSPLSWKRTVDMVAASGCTCVIFHWWTLFWAPVFALIARQLRKRGIRVVFLGHNLADHDAGRTKARLANRLLSSADAYIVHSTEQAAAIGALRPDAPVLHRLHPVYDRFPAPRGLLPKRGRLEVLFFGFIRPYKGLNVLLEALESMADDGVFLTVVGECWDQADGKAIESSRQRLGTNLEVRLEYVDDAQAAEYFARADVVALPYLDATGSGVVALAYHYRTPVLATRVGGLKDAVVEGSTGWLVAPGSPADLAGTLGRITRESAAGLAQGIEDFVARNTWDALADDICGFVRQEVREHDGAPRPGEDDR